MTGRIVVLVATVCSPSLVGASPIFFSSRPDFDTAVVPTRVEGFEDPFETASSVAFDGFTVTEVSDFANINSRIDYVSAGERALGFTWNGDTQFRFDFSPPITGFAADILDFGTCCSAMTLDVVSDTGEINHVAATGGDLPRGNLQFWGFESSDPISSLSFSSQSLSDNDLIVFDQVAFRTVPEPSGKFVAMVAMLMMLIQTARLLGGQVTIHLDLSC
ncbi:MAG: hypothetical protein KDB27_12305 [Planctomycetales bacterium]|nr:hypothetical protein [Planctomycetales bacterium]